MECRLLQAQSSAFVSAWFPFLNYYYLCTLMSSDGLRFKKHMSNRK